MGWTFIRGASRRDIIEDLTKRIDGHSMSSETLRHCLVGNVLYSVREYTRIRDRLGARVWEQWRECNVDILDRGDGGGWGYKSLSEVEGPLYFACPLSYLKLAEERPDESLSEASRGYRDAWRARVRDYHAATNRARRIRREVTRSGIYRMSLKDARAAVLAPKGDAYRRRVARIIRNERNQARAIRAESEGVASHG